MAALQRWAALGKGIFAGVQRGAPTHALTSLPAVEEISMSSAFTSLQQWGALSWQRVSSVIPSLADARLLAVPKRKVGFPRLSFFSCISLCLVVTYQLARLPC